MTDTMRRTATLATTIAAATLAATASLSAQQHQAEKRTVELSEQNQSDVHGRALIYTPGAGAAQPAQGGEAGTAKHRVDLALKGLEAGETYRIHLHGGTCAKGGQVIMPLLKVKANDEGRATGTATVPAEKLAAAEGEKTGKHANVFVQARLPDDTPVACGDVPRMQPSTQTNTS